LAIADPCGLRRNPNILGLAIVHKSKKIKDFRQQVVTHLELHRRKNRPLGKRPGRYESNNGTALRFAVDSHIESAQEYGIESKPASSTGKGPTLENSKSKACNRQL